MSINENKLSASIARREGGRLALSIGQIKEVQKILLRLLSKEKMSSVVLLVEKHKSH